MNRPNRLVCIYLTLCVASVTLSIFFVCALLSHIGKYGISLFEDTIVHQSAAVSKHSAVNTRSPEWVKQPGLGKEHTNNVSRMHVKAVSDQTGLSSDKKVTQPYPLLQDTSSRLVFKEAITKYWTPTDVVNMDLPFTNRSLTHYTGNGTKLIVFDNIPDWLGRAINGHMPPCRYNNCLLSMDGSLKKHANAVLFNGLSMPPKPPPRKTGQVWVLFIWESPYHHPKTMYRPEWRRELNWTMTYRTNSDFFSPVGMFVPVLKPQPYRHLLNIVQKKTKAVAWLVSHCGTVSRRIEYVKRLQKIIDVDIFGNCGTMKCPKSEPECLNMLQHTYMFYLSFENSLCKDYITEKLYKVFDKACVSVVRGGADYKHLVPNGTYINAADFSSPEALGRHLKGLMSNTSAYMDILMTKEQYRVLGSGHVKNMSLCELCYRLNNPGTWTRAAADLEQWTRECHAPTDLDS